MQIISEFKLGCVKGWNMYWSPFVALARALEKLISHSNVDNTQEA